MLDNEYMRAVCLEMRRTDLPCFMALIGMPLAYDFDIYCARTKEEYEQAKIEKFKTMARNNHDASLV